MTLYAQGLRQARLPWLLWTLVIVLAVIFVASAGSAIATAPTVFTSVMRDMPSRLLALFGGAALLRDPVDSYLVTKLFLYLPLLGGLAGAFQAASLARELESGQGDFLLALPVRRAQVYRARLLALLTSLLALWLVTGIAAVLFLHAYHLAVGGRAIATIAYAGFLVDAVLSAGALALGALAPTYRGALRLALGVAVAPLVVDWALQMALVPRGWRFVLPYGYFDPGQILVSHPFPWAATLVLMPAVVLIAIAGERAFERREV